MALSTARMHKVRGRPPLLAAGINSLIHSHSSSVRSLGYVFSFIYPFYTTHEDFSDRLLEQCKIATALLRRRDRESPIRGTSNRAQFRRALRIAGIVSAVKGGRVGNRSWGKRMIAIKG